MERLSFGVGPAALGSGTETLRKDFARILRDALGLSVRLVTTRSYAQLYDQIVAGQVDVAWLPPALFIRAHDAHGAKLLLSSVHSTSSQYYGLLFVRDDSPARDLEDLRGKTVAWVDGSSCAGYLFPRLTMSERGVDPHGFFAAEMGAGTHAGVVDAVATGTADAGAVYGHVLHADGAGERQETAAWDHSPAGVEMRTLLRSRAIPNPVVCAASTLSGEVGDLIIERLVTLHEDGQAPAILDGLLQVRRFQRATMKDYEVVRAALNVTHSQQRRRGRGRGRGAAER